MNQELITTIKKEAERLAGKIHNLVLLQASEEVPPYKLEFDKHYDKLYEKAIEYTKRLLDEA